MFEPPAKPQRLGTADVSVDVLYLGVDLPPACEVLVDAALECALHHDQWLSVRVVPNRTGFALHRNSRIVDERAGKDGMRREPHGVAKNQAVVRQLGQREATDADVAAVLVLVVVFERELDPVAWPEVEPSPPEPVTLTRRHEITEGPLGLQ